MASQATFSGDGKTADHLQLQDMAAKLLVKLSDHGLWEAWDRLQGTLAEVATYMANPEITVNDLLGLLKEREPSSLQLGHPEADALLQNIVASLEEEAERALKAKSAILWLRELLLVVPDQLGMLPLCNSEPVHMVDGDSKFCKANVAGMVKCSPHLSVPNAPYAVVSIVGAQSSGKSYLLNRLFATNFPVMDAKRGRSQTTRGIMISRCVGPSLVVLDIEGFDGKEKGEDTLFEKQAALFALTISDIMLVNMNVFDIGRELAGATLLFKTIFKERIKLPKCITKILVVIRMYDGETPPEIMRDDMINSLKKMWKSVNKESLKLEDYIEVNVVLLPDKKSNDFPKEVTALRRLLSKTTLENKRIAKVPASGFPASSSLFWDEIKENKELDIPSHKVALARLFCRQTAEDVINSLGSCEDYKHLKAEGSPPGFKERSDALLKSIIRMYDLETEMYDVEERNNGRQYMVEKLNKVITEVSHELIRKMRKNCLNQLKGECAKQLENPEESAAYSNNVDERVDSCVENFENSFADLKVFDSDYLQKTSEGLRKVLLSHLYQHNFTMQEKRWRKELELAQQRSDKNVEEFLKQLEEAIQKRQHAEEDLRRQYEKELREEMNCTQNMLSELIIQQKKTEQMNAKKPKGCNIM